MPLLRRKPFERIKPSLNFRDDEELFYSALTKEVFQDYEEFCKRVILCNSVVWSCALTGKPGLTYQEALDSERNARQSLKDFPKELRAPVLYLASLTHRTSFGELSEDVFSYVRERYFVGEHVEVWFNSEAWFECRVCNIIAPRDDYVTKFSASKPEDFNNSVASLYHYEVEKLDSCNDDVSEIHLVEASHIKRRKGAYTRERSKLFLKQHVAQDKTGLWIIKDRTINKYCISKLNFGEIFVGASPVFEASKKFAKCYPPSSKHLVSNVQNGGLKKKRQESIEKYFTSPNMPVPSKFSPAKQPRQQSPTKQQIFSNKMSTKKMVTLDKKKSPSKRLAKKLKDKYAANSRKDELNKKLLENHKLKNVMIPLQKKNLSMQEKQKRIEEKLREREKRKEEKARLAEFMKEWNRHREDLELEDLKILPIPSVINCGIPDENFGDFVMILEFFQSFRDILSLKSFFPGGVVSFEVMVRALVTKEVAGPLSDMIQMLLQTLFNMQEEEDDEILETNNLNTDVGLDMDKIGDVTTSEAMKAATAAVNWSQLSQGTPLNKLSLDAVALSEVLRLHLLSSGGRSGELSSKWRYQQRGGYTSLDDPGLQLRIEHPHILRALSITSVCELPLGDKVKILTCLINQILTYAVVRDLIDERGDKMKQIKADLKAMQVAQSKKQREATALRIKEKKEAKLRLAESNPALSNNTAIAPAPPNIEVEELEKSSDSKTAEACKLKVEKETLRKKQEWLKKTQDMHQAAMGFQLLPLGFDRGYRRYWLFSSISGLFVENDERFPGVCLSKATPCDPNLACLDDTVSYVRKLFEDERNCGSDKENDVCEVGTNRSGQVLSPNKKLLAESGLTVLNVRPPIQLDVKAEPISEESKLQPPLLACTTNRSTCPVHSGGMSRTKWAYFSTEEEIASLIKSLNKRGVRESDLRRTLIQQQERVVMNVKQCPVRKLDKSLPDEDSEQRKSTRAVKVPKYDGSNLGFPTDMAVETVLNLSLRDSILQLEDKIEMGGLGSLQVYSREAWQSALSSGSYDQQCASLRWGKRNNCKTDYNSTDNIPVEKLRYEESTSRSTTPTLELVKNDPASSLTRQDSLTQQLVMRNLASAILQVAQSVGAKYMQKPLGPDESPDEKQTVWPAMERWEISLMASTSFAQLFLHLFTLDNSIQWSKSALNAHCRICRGRRDPENMLLCDGCNKGHHLYCLKPKLSKIPAGDWFCHKCRPKDKVRTPKKSRRLFSEESDQEEIAEDKSVVNCSKCGFEGRLAHCEGCSRYFHKKCTVPHLKKIHKHWMCTDCVPKESSPKSSKRKFISDAVESPEPKQRRCSASAAVVNISKYAKQLQRSDSWNDDGAINDEDEDDEDEEMQPSRRSHRRSQVLDQSLPLDNAILQDLLMELIHHKDAWPFLRPVQKAQVPDYHLIIKRPMDFGRIKNKLNMLVYVHNSEFIADTLLVFENCQMYNQSEAEEYKAGARMSRFFRKRCRQLGLQIPDEATRPPAKKPRPSS